MGSYFGVVAAAAGVFVAAAGVAGVAGDVADVAGVATAVAVAVAAAFAVVAATAAAGLAAVPSRRFVFGSDFSKESAKKRKLQIQIFFSKSVRILDLTPETESP